MLILCCIPRVSKRQYHWICDAGPVWRHSLWDGHRGTCIPRAAKSNHLKLFAVFPATDWNFSVKFYKFMWLSYLHLTAKRHLMIFKYDEVDDISAWPLSDFRAACWKKKHLRGNRRGTFMPVTCPVTICRYKASSRTHDQFVASRNLDTLPSHTLSFCAF